MFFSVPVALDVLLDWARGVVKLVRPRSKGALETLMGLVMVRCPFELENAAGNLRGACEHVVADH